MLFGYVFSDLLVSGYAFYKSGKAEFGKFEFFIIVLTVVCALLYVWCEKRKNFTPAVIVNSVACMLAGVPQLVDAFRNPQSVSLVVCSIYMAVSGLSYYGEQNTLNGRLLPGVSVIYWVVIIIGAVS